MDPAGFLLVDKPLEWTSHDVVAKLRGITGIRKIGHGGTLDPLATGLLVIGIGAATKQLEQYVQGDKTYLATVRLGAASTTDDAEGEVSRRSVGTEPTEAAITAAMAGFVGDQDQLPPTFSALKTDGKKHYELARAGKPVVRKPRQITIHSVEPVKIAYPDVTFRCRVSKGTYIRSIARDLGERLDVGGYLTALRRESVGEFTLAEAASLTELQADWQHHLLPLTEKSNKILS
jgi:tRNA pseudouridine55 synthase